MNSNNFEIYRARLKIEEKEEWLRWAIEIPFLEFPAGWKIKAIPPYCGAIARFQVRREDTKENQSVSAYLDCYDRLGFAGGLPYWEIYPAFDGDTYRCRIDKTDILLREIGKALDGLKKD